MKHTMMRKMTMLVSALVALALLIYGLSLSPLAHAASTDNASGNATSSTSGSAVNNASGNGSSSSATVPSQCTAIIPADSSAQQTGLDQLIQPSGDIKDGPDGPDGNPTSFTQAFSFNNSVT